MYLPNMKYADDIRKVRQIRFGGLNRSLGAGDGELRDMKNLTADHFPLLSVRERRQIYKRLENPQGIFCWGKLCWVADGNFYYDGHAAGAVNDGEKIFAGLGSYIIIMPDKRFYNIETGEFGTLDTTLILSAITFRDGTIYGAAAKANEMYAVGADWARAFRVGDAVTISGCTTKTENNKTVIIREIEGDTLRFYENTFLLPDGASDYEEKRMTVSRVVPDLRFFCENENRLWGCDETTIYACKPGDIFNWNVFDGLDTDSWRVDTGTPEPFTGCVSYGGFPVFFKENRIYKVYGSMPSNFQLLSTATSGLKEECHRSLSVAGEVLYYLSDSGVMAYGGGVPQSIGGAFGTERFSGGVAGSDGLKYYISMMDASGKWGLYVYDTRKGLWHREDDTCALGFAMYDGRLYCLDAEGNIMILSGDPVEDTEAEEAKVEWFAEFADFTEDDPNRKGIGKIQIRLELEKGASVQVLLQTDSDGVWRKVKEAIGTTGKRSFYLPIVPRRADHYRIRLEGTGMCRIHSLTRETYSGSELP